MKTQAPIILFTYRRVDTLDQCIRSLKKCPETKFSDLIIVSDFQATERDCDKVASVRRFLPSISGFKSIEIIERNENFGVDYTIIEGIKMMATRFPEFIVIEDDLVVQEGFLHFLNASLNFFKDNPEVLTVAGFSFVDKIPKEYKYDGYFAKITCPWGWATWSNKIKEVDWKIEDRDYFLQNKEVQKKFNEWGSDRSAMLRKTLKGKIRAWDIRLDYFQFKMGTTTFYPIASFVNNIGFNNSEASNTHGFNRYKTKLKPVHKDKYIFPESIHFNKTISANFIWKNSLFLRIYTQIMKALNYKN